jgi:hypothetical protein
MCCVLLCTAYLSHCQHHMLHKQTLTHCGCCMLRVASCMLYAAHLSHSQHHMLSCAMVHSIVLHALYSEALCCAAGTFSLCNAHLSHRQHHMLHSQPATHCGCCVLCCVLHALPTSAMASTICTACCAAAGALWVLRAVLCAACCARPHCAVHCLL